MRKMVLALLCGLGVAGGSGLPSFGSPFPDLTDSSKALMKSRTPLDLAESFLVIQETGAVRDYREALQRRGKDETANRVKLLEELYAGNNAGAMQVFEYLKNKDPWSVSRGNYLKRLMDVQRSFSETKSEHYLVRTASDDVFLASYALPSLETAYGRVSEFLGSSPTVPIVIEIYPSLDTYASAAEQPPETIERRGSVVSSHYGRVMVLSPGATAFGYRWLDGMVHEIVHRQLNQITGGHCPVWLHEGTARYLEVSWRKPEGFTHSPRERALLSWAVLRDSGTTEGVLPLELWESSLSDLGSTGRRDLAYAQSSDAVDFFVQEFGVEKLRALLHSFRTKNREDSFKGVLGMSETDFEKNWKESLVDLTEVPAGFPRGLLSSPVRFGVPDDLRLVDGPTRDLLSQGDQLQQKGSLDRAVIEFKKAVDQEPDNAVALVRLAGVYVILGKRPSAEELLKRAIEKNTFYATPYLALGNIYFDDGRYEEAQQLLQQAIEIAPFQSKIHEILGLIAVDMGNFVLAKESLGLALRFDPTNSTVRKVLEHMPSPR